VEFGLNGLVRPGPAMEATEVLDAKVIPSHRAGTEKCPWVMPVFSPAWTLARLSLQDKDNLHNL
jgi:hypothetical protein